MHSGGKYGHERPELAQPPGIHLRIISILHPGVHPGKSNVVSQPPGHHGHPPPPARSRGAARRARPAVPRTFTFRPELNSPSVRLGSDKDKLRYEHSDRLFIWPLCGLVDRTE